MSTVKSKEAMKSGPRFAAEETPRKLPPGANLYIHFNIHFSLVDFHNKPVFVPLYTRHFWFSREKRQIIIHFFLEKY